MRVPWLLVAGVVIALQAFGWAGSCAANRARIKLHKIVDADYAAQLKAKDDSLTAQRARGIVERKVYLTQRVLVPAQAETVRVALVRGDTLAGLEALGRILRAGEACDRGYTACEARAALEKRRGDLATAMVDTVRGWWQEERRLARVWRPFSLRPPGVLWAAALMGAGIAIGGR